MYISIDAFRSFDEAAQNFLQYPTSTLDEKCHLSVVTFFFFTIGLPNLIHGRVFVSYPLHLF